MQVKMIDPTRKKRTVIMIPYPAQGHVTPMLKLASSLSTHGFQPLIILPEFIHRSIVDKVNVTTTRGVIYMSIPDGLDESKSRDFFAIERSMEDHMPAHLDRLIRDIDGGVACMVVDVLASWAINVGEGFGLKLVGFWPAMLATYSLLSFIPDMVRIGLISDSGLPRIQGDISYPYQPPLSIEDLPWLIGTETTKIARFKFWSRTMARSKTFNCILVNSFPNEFQIDTNSIKQVSSPKYGPKVYPIGPLKINEVCQSPTFWKEDSSCLGWLAQQKPNSVVYISFGSWVSPIGEESIENLAWALEELKRSFIWVIGPGWRNGLPNGYIEKVENFGKVVAWAPQVNVLQHEAIGCYLTHCGWNSTLEAIECKKTMLCFPVAGDQALNCGYIVNVWKIGVKLNGFCFDDLSDGIDMITKDRSMKTRIEELSDKIMGRDAISQVKNNMLSFVNDLMKDQSLNYCN